MLGFKELLNLQLSQLRRAQGGVCVIKLMELSDLKFVVFLLLLFFIG